MPIGPLLLFSRDCGPNDNGWPIDLSFARRTWAALMSKPGLVLAQLHAGQGPDDATNRPARPCATAAQPMTQVEQQGLDKGHCWGQHHDEEEGPKEGAEDGSEGAHKVHDTSKTYEDERKEAKVVPEIFRAWLF